jgi:hypothetical protein
LNGKIIAMNTGVAGRVTAAANSGDTTRFLKEFYKKYLFISTVNNLFLPLYLF